MRNALQSPFDHNDGSGPCHPSTPPPDSSSGSCRAGLYDTSMNSRTTWVLNEPALASVILTSGVRNTIL